MPQLPSEVQIKGCLLGRIKELRYNDHDLIDVKKFPNFQPEKYLISEHDGEVQLPVPWDVPI